MNNKQAFFYSVRANVFGRLNQGQVDGMEAILDYYADAYSDLNSLAYILATAFWESGRTMQPVNEYGTDNYFFSMYDMHGSRPAVAARLGNVFPGDGVRYHGRGQVQLTGRGNYRRAGHFIGLDLENYPDRALELKVSVQILVEGMVHGIFTSRKLADYFQGQEDPIGARAIVNGKDQAQKIAQYYYKFKAAIVAATQSVPA